MDRQLIQPSQFQDFSTRMDSLFRDISTDFFSDFDLVPLDVKLPLMKQDKLETMDLKTTHDDKSYNVSTIFYLFILIINF